MSRTRLVPAVAAIAAALLGSACGFTEPAIDPITKLDLNRVEIPGEKGKTANIDIMAVDQAGHRMWVADGLDGHHGIDLFDISSVPARFVTSIAVTPIPLGMALAPDLHSLYVGLDDSSVAVIETDVSSAQVNTVLTTISTKGSGPTDLLEYDGRHHKVFAGNPDDGFVSVIDTTTNTVTAKIDGVGRVDQPRFDEVTGLVYVGDIDHNAIDVIDPVHDKLLRTQDIGVTCEPHGIAIKPGTNFGIIGCGNREDPSVVAWDFGNGSLLKRFDQSGAGDAVIYDPKVDQFFFGASNYSPPELSIFSGTGAPGYLTSVPTGHKSHSVAYDEAHDIIYTYDGRNLEAGLWYFPNPVVGKN